MMWQAWFYLSITLIIVVVVFYSTTPFVLDYTTETYRIGNFTHTATNTSFHNLIDYNKQMWNLWPLAAFVVVLLMLFYVASGDEDERVIVRGG